MTTHSAEVTEIEEMTDNYTKEMLRRGAEAMTTQDELRDIQAQFEKLARLVANIDFQRGHVSFSEPHSRFREHLADAKLWALQVVEQETRLSE
mgnify:CR=1 FL=1